MEQSTRGPSVAHLAGPRMPADHGLSSLGLLMQLAGSIFMVTAGFMALMPIFGGGAPGLWVLFLVAAMAAVRSAFHRAAGSDLVYGSPRGPFSGVHTYVVVSGLQTAATLALLWFQGLRLGFGGMLSLVILLMAWPATLAVLLRRPRLRALVESGEIPPAEDNGFEGVAVLMALLGAVGTCVAGLMLVLLFKLPSEALSSPHALLTLGVFGMLLVRSVMHTVAGIKGTSGIDADGATESASRYFSFGVVSSVIAGAALLLQMMTSGFHPALILVIASVVYLLLLWPLLVRRFFTERNFSIFLAGSEAPVHRRAPDAGLTALGWLLLGFGVFGLATSLPGALFGGGGELDNLFGTMGGSDALLGDFGRSPWWGVGLAALQAWAGFELTEMSDRSQLAATIYAGVGTVLTIYLYLPVLDQLGGASRVLGLGSAMLQPLIYGQIVLALIVPIGTLILVHRKITPDASARLRDQE